jgi:hypothetical protein
MSKAAFHRELAAEITSLQKWVRELAEASAAATAALARIEHQEGDDQELLDHLTDAKTACDNACEGCAALRGLYGGWAAAQEKETGNDG